MPSQGTFGEEASSFIGNFGDDDLIDNASNKDYEFNFQAYTGHKKSWTASSYTRTRNVYQYDLDNDATLP